MARKDTRGGSGTFRSTRGGLKVSMKTPSVKAGGGRKKKGTNRKAGERGLRYGTPPMGSRNSPSQSKSRSDGS